MTISAGERTRRQVLDAAIRVIDRDGVDAVTHRRVGQEAGLSHGVVSYHFRTRDELIYRSFEYHLGSVEDYGARIGLEEGGKLTLGGVIEVLARLVAEELANPTSMRVDLELTLYGTRKPEMAVLLNAWIQRGVDKLAEGLTKSGYLDAQAIASALTNLTRGFLLDCLITPSLCVADFTKRADLLLGDGGTLKDRRS